MMIVLVDMRIFQIARTAIGGGKAIGPRRFVIVHGAPSLPSLSYYFLQRADDHRDMVEAMLTYVMGVADFTSLTSELALAVKSTGASELV